MYFNVQDAKLFVLTVFAKLEGEEPVFKGVYYII